MKSLLIFAKSNLRKTKSQSIAVFLLLLITSFLFSLCLSVSLGYSDSFEELHIKENGPDCSFVVAGAETEIDKFENGYIKQHEGIYDYEILNVVIMDGEITYGDYFYKALTLGLSISDAINKKIGSFIIDDVSGDSGVYLPYEFYVSGNYEIGSDFIFYNNNEEKINCKVVGFYEETSLSGLQDRIVSYVFTDDIFEGVVKPLYTNELINSSLFSLILKDKNQTKIFEYDTINSVRTDYKFMKILESNTKSLSKSSRYATQIIATAVLGVSTCVFALVSIILIASNISFFIQTNMKSYGMLKAIGYNSKKLRMVLNIQFLFIDFTASIVGIALSYIILPFFNKSLESLTGIRHLVKFSFVNLAIVLFGLLLVVMISVLFASTKIKKLTPLNAIRNSASKKQLKNHLPVESNNLNIDINLALKNAVINIKQSIVILFTIMGISLGIVFSILMCQNIIYDPISMIELTSQKGDIEVDISSSNVDELTHYLSSDERVSNYVLYKKSSKVLINNKDPLLSIIVGDSNKLINGSFCYKGHYPIKDNEVCVGGLYASKNNIKIGDSVIAEFGDNSIEYVVSGFIQNAGDEGENILFTKDGYEKLEKLNTFSYLIILDDAADKEQITVDIINSVNGATVIDYKSLVDATIMPFISLMKAIIIGVTIICLSLIVFVLYNIVRTILFKKKMEFSIMKAIGYSTNRLMKQMAMSFVPIIVISLIICLPIACVTINPIFSIFVSGVGIVHPMFKFSYLFVAITGVIVLLISTMFVYLLSIRIKKNSPKDLLG